MGNGEDMANQTDQNPGFHIDKKGENQNGIRKVYYEISLVHRKVMQSYVNDIV